MSGHDHENRDEPIIMTSPGRMTRGLIIMVVTLALGTVVTVTQWENFFSQPPAVARLGTGTPPPPPPTEEGITTIAILAGSAVQGNPDYDPDDDATVPINHRVVWVNQDTVPHTSTSGTGPTDPQSAARFDTGIVNGGESSDEIEIEGEVGETIPYYCIVHPYMTSQLTLVEAQEGAGGSGPTLDILAGSAVQGNPDYEPDPMTVAAGEAITVVNLDNVPHTVTSGTGPTDPESGRAFDTSIMDVGATATIDTTGLDPGSYDYYCIVHPYMVGTLQITE